MNKIKNYVTTHLRLNQIDMLEVVTLLMNCLIKYNKVCVPNKKEDSNLSDFNMITEINESKI